MSLHLLGWIVLNEEERLHEYSLIVISTTSDSSIIINIEVDAPILISGKSNITQSALEDNC